MNRPLTLRRLMLLTAGTRCRAGIQGTAVLWVLLALLLTAPWARADQALVVLDDNARSITLWSALAMLPDPERRFTAQVLLDQNTDFVPMPTTQGTLGVRPEAVWLRVPLALARHGCQRARHVGAEHRRPVAVLRQRSRR